jgi:hypothetical protein
MAMILLAGCGRKTALVPPQVVVPVAIQDLRFSLDENGATLQWSYPRKLETGEALFEVESFEVWRAVIPVEDYCEGCPVRFDGPEIVDGGPLPDSGKIKIARYVEGSLQSGYRYIYKVRSRAGWWYPSRDSNIVGFVWMSPPEPPADLQINIGDRRLSLGWQKTEKAVDGSIISGEPVYQVYRSRDGKTFKKLGDPVAENSFIDVGVENSKEYYYSIRALRRTGETLQAGAASGMAVGIPRDLTPPSPPHIQAAERFLCT